MYTFQYLLSNLLIYYLTLNVKFCQYFLSVSFSYIALVLPVLPYLMNGCRIIKLDNIVTFK